MFSEKYFEWLWILYKTDGEFKEFFITLFLHEQQYPLHCIL